MCTVVQRICYCGRSSDVFVQARRWFKPNRHMIPKFQPMKKAKFMKIDLPDTENLHQPDKITPEQLRSRMKKEGIPPLRPWRERPIHMASLGEVIDAYLPPEGDGRVSLISKDKAIQTKDAAKALVTSRNAIRTIGNYDKDFDQAAFGDEALKILIEAHQALANRDEDRLHELVSESLFPDMWNELKLRTLKWEYVETLEAPKVVHVRKQHLASKDNLFAQVTVRLRSKQKLAIYDQFGRLFLGDPDVAQDVLEYVVLEKHLANEYSSWRIVSKITPKWIAKQKQPVLKTFKEPPLPPSRANETSHSTFAEPATDAIVA